MKRDISPAPPLSPPPSSNQWDNDDIMDYGVINDDDSNHDNDKPTDSNHGNKPVVEEEAMEAADVYVIYCLCVTSITLCVCM